MIAAKLPKELTKLQSLGIEVNETNIEIIVLLSVYFGFGNYQKIKLWLTTKNPNFGNIAPLKLMQIGRSKKVLAFVDVATDQGTPSFCKIPFEYVGEL